MSKLLSEARASSEARLLLDTLEALGSSLDLSRTADHVLAGSKALFAFETASIYVRERHGRAIVCQRARVESEDAREARRLESAEDLPGRVLRSGRASSQLVVTDEERGPNLRDSTPTALAAPIIGGGGRVLGVITVESDEASRYSNDALELLMSYSRASAPSIERALLYAENVSGRRITSELEVARQVMSGLLPSDAPRLDGFDIAAVIEPAYEVGGDYYDFIPLGNDRWAFAMADVSGKGAPAALVVAAMRATLYTLAKRELALRAILQRANEFIHASTGPKAKYVTLFYLVLDAQTRRFIYINAGHLPPIVLRKNGDVELLRSGGFPLGFFDNPRYFEQFVQLESGDLLCLYTDGITEATNAEDEDYGRSRLLGVLKEHQSAAAAEVCRTVLSDVRRFSGGAPTDDATVLVIRSL